MPPENQGTRIANLENKVNSLDGALVGIKGRLDGIQQSLDQNILPVNSIGWRVIIVLSAALVALVGVSFGGFTWYHASKITSTEQGITKVQNDLDSRITTTKGELSGQIEQLKNDFNGQYESLHGELREFIKLFVKTPEDVVANTKRAVSASRDRLPHTLPTARTVLAVAKEKSIPLPAPKIQGLAQPLLNNKAGDEALGYEVQSTLSALASYRTFSDSRLQPLQQELIAAAKASGNYFEKRDIFLGERQLWANSVFKNCVIITGGGSAKLSLQNVSFVNCIFQQEDGQDLAGQRLAAAIIRTPQPTISVVLYDFPVGKDKSAAESGAR